MEAETYVWAEGVKSLEDGEWDFEEFRREKMGRWVGNDEEYEGEPQIQVLSTRTG